MIKTICVAGAGTMGSGIALVAAQNGFQTLLFDLNPEALERAKKDISDSISYLIDKKKIAPGEGAIFFDRIQFTGLINECIADIFIEAIIENAEAKISLFNQLAAFNAPHSVFATNTSSLSVSAIQSGIFNPGRVAGMHFFNPAPVMKLVEVVNGKQTSAQTLQIIFELCKAMQKVPVYCEDSPGFIVNRIARHYYLEAMRIVEGGGTTIAEVDALMEARGFKMGPFKLMDLIGMDINLAVTKSIHEGFERMERFAPSALQEHKVADGELGRKTGKGFYDYTPSK